MPGGVVVLMAVENEEAMSGVLVCAGCPSILMLALVCGMMMVVPEEGRMVERILVSRIGRWGC